MLLFQNVTKKMGGMKHFFKPFDIEIDKEIDENFDLTSYRGHTSTEHKESLIGNQIEVEIDHPDLSVNHDEDDDKPEVMIENVDDRVPLEVQFKKVCSQYSDIKRKRAKWNGFSEKLSKPAYINDHVPDILKKFHADHSKKTNENRVFKTNKDPWLTYSNEKRIEIFKFMFMLTKQDELNASKSKSSFCDPVVQKNDTEVETQPNSLVDSQVQIVQIEHQSKYASQLKVPTDQIISTMASLQNIASSTPHKMFNLNRIPVDPIHSPIVKISLAYNWEQAHFRNRKRRRDAGGPKWYLKFLGLNTVYDLFSNDFDECPQNTSNIVNCSDEKQSKLCDTLNKSVCGNENLIEEESQYTVSRILKICEDAERGGNDKCEPVHSRSTLRRRRLYIGSVDDLFCEDNGNDDDDGDDDVIINTQAIDVTLSESDDTVNYDVEDAMAHQKSLHHSISLFKDIIGDEPSNKSSNIVAKSVTGVKSDELFSTYNESVANVSKLNASNANCQQNNAQQEQSIQTTPKKTQNSNSFVYHNRSPSILIKSTSVLSTRLDKNQADRELCDTNQIGSSNFVSKPTLLSSKLSILNTQLSQSKHFEHLDEVKENVSSPYFTVRSPDAPNSNYNQNTQLQPGVDSNCDTDFSGDEIFSTCRSFSVLLQNIFTSFLLHTN